MIVFDNLVDEALEGQGELGALRIVVEKEILHHGILLILRDAGILPLLVFIGGTCLRNCYGSSRLSEDLDFTCMRDLDASGFQELPEIFKSAFQRKYELAVEVRTTKEKEGAVKTWKLLIQTRPERHLPAQRIHLDINQMPSYDVSPMMLRNHYGINLGTSGLILNCESRKEILTDKYLALGLRDNRIKNRNLWDIAWLTQQGVEAADDILGKKLTDHGVSVGDYILRMESRVGSLTAEAAVREDFIAEMKRFLPTRLSARPFCPKSSGLI